MVSIIVTDPSGNQEVEVGDMHLQIPLAKKRAFPMLVVALSCSVTCSSGPGLLTELHTSQTSH